MIVYKIIDKKHKMTDAIKNAWCCSDDKRQIKKKEGEKKTRNVRLEKYHELSLKPAPTASEIQPFVGNSHIVRKLSCKSNALEASQSSELYNEKAELERAMQQSRIDETKTIEIESLKQSLIEVVAEMKSLKQQLKGVVELDLPAAEIVSIIRELLY